MNNTLYLECASGISGDMTVASLLSLGADENKLKAALQSLHVQGYHCIISDKKSHGIMGKDFDVILEHTHHHEHHHEHSRETHSHHHHEHRHLKDINHIIDHAEITDNAKQLAKKIFMIIAEAEGKAHGCSIDDVHFHEVGAIDSIVDIVAAAVCFDDLDISHCVVTGLSEGSGFVKCEHGVLPVPVPAVVNIAESHQIPLRPVNVDGELVTPTGIAIAAALRTDDKLPACFTVTKTGIGLGKKDVGRPNLLRAMLIRENTKENRVFALETNIDDCTGEELGMTMDVLLESGALDVHFTPCFMKKNRPGWLLRVICKEELLEAVEKLIFKHTTTIGIRRTEVLRTEMNRCSVDVPLPEGSVSVKKCTYQNITKYYPEYESVKKLAEETGEDFKTIYNLASVEASKHEK